MTERHPALFASKFSLEDLHERLPSAASGSAVCDALTDAALTRCLKVPQKLRQLVQKASGFVDRPASLPPCLGSPLLTVSSPFALNPDR